MTKFSKSKNAEIIKLDYLEDNTIWHVPPVSKRRLRKWAKEVKKNNRKVGLSNLFKGWTFCYGSCIKTGKKETGKSPKFIKACPGSAKATP